MQIDVYETWDIMILAPLWQYVASSTGYVHFVISPVGLIYFIWFWPSLYIVKVAYNAITQDDWTRWRYGKTVSFLMIIQIVIGLLIPVARGFPPVLCIPIVFPGIIALILTRRTVPTKDVVWDPSSEESDPFNQ